MRLRVKDIVNICHGELLFGDENTYIENYSKDTRTLNAGDCYIGIKGDNFDGNMLFEDAFNKGAGTCILENESVNNYEFVNMGRPIILVDNAKEALKDIASYIRNNSKALFIGVTGSVGKTSTRDMIYSVVSKKYKSLKTEGNYNNDIGLPLTIMRLDKEEAAVIEMGMNNLGEIDYLTRITKPHIAVITNVGTAHIGNLGSRENILKAKLEIVNGLDKDGILVINNDNDLLHEYYLKNNDHVISVGINNLSDIMAKDINILDDRVLFKIVYRDEEYECECLVPNISFVYNSLIAFAVGILAKVDIDDIIQGIKDVKLTSKRLEIIKTNKLNIINDSYNASLDSMKSSLDILKNKKGRKVAILGDMKELGSFSKKLHEEVGEYAAKCKIDLLVTIGEYASDIGNGALKEGFTNIKTFNNKDEFINNINGYIKRGDNVLVKASNSLRFWEIVKVLEDF